MARATNAPARKRAQAPVTKRAQAPSRKVAKKTRASTPAKAVSKRKGKSAAPKDLDVQNELNRLKRQLFVLERMRFDNLRGSSASADPALLAAGVAHEFNNILGAADGHAEWALDSGKTQDMVEALQIVRQACVRSSQVTRALQGLAQPREEGREVFDVSKLFDELARMFSARAKLNRVDFRVTTLEAPTYGDFGRLLEVLMNLVKNAFEAVEGRGASPRVTVTGQEKDLNLSIDVIDTGEGIPQALIDKVFLPFFTTKGVLKRVSQDAGVEAKAQTPGSGLGLFLSRSIVEEHGGRLEILPAPKAGGAHFRITLPRVDR